MSASWYTFFNKYTIVNNTITEGYTCQTFGISGFEPVCLMGSTDGSTYGDDTTGNKGILKSLQVNTAFTGNNPAGSCNFINSDSADCDIYYSSLRRRLYLGSYFNGVVNAGDNYELVGCSAGGGNTAGCAFYEPDSW